MSSYEIAQFPQFSEDHHPDRFAFLASDDGAVRGGGRQERLGAQWALESSFREEIQMNEDQVVAGARDAAKELGYEITATSIDHQGGGKSAYSFAFKAGDLEATVDLTVSAVVVARFGLTLRDYARWEILDALRGPGGDDTRLH